MGLVMSLWQPFETEFEVNLLLVVPCDQRSFSDACLLAHRRLYARGILHRDISLYNLLLGNDDDKEAIDRIYGFVIDLDMAIFHEKRERNQVSAQVKSVRLDWLHMEIALTDHLLLQGTRRYQSIAVLSSYAVKPDDPHPPHDYLDDLESFFYVFGDLILSRVCDGKQIDLQVTKLLEGWEDKEAINAARCKLVFTGLGFDITLVDRDYWGAACTELFAGFHQVLQDIILKKDSIRKKPISMEEKIAQYKALGLDGKIEEHYDRLEFLFNKALKALETEEPIIDARLKKVSSSHTGSKSRSKRDARKVEDMEPSERPVKRRNPPRNTRKAALLIPNDTLHVD